jgi:hypothetical protein
MKRCKQFKLARLNQNSNVGSTAEVYNLGPLTDIQLVAENSGFGLVLPHSHNLKEREDVQSHEALL